MPTSLAFRTPVGGVSIPAGQSKELGSVDVHQFSKIWSSPTSALALPQASTSGSPSQKEANWSRNWTLFRWLPIRKSRGFMTFRRRS